MWWWILACTQGEPDSPLDSSSEPEAELPELSCEQRGSYEGGLVITSLAELEAFGAEHRAITGSLWIEDSTDIQDLSALRCLDTVRLSLGIEGNAALTEIELPALRELRTLRLIDNEELITAELDGLEGLGDELVLAGNPGLSFGAAGLSEAVHVEIGARGARSLSLPALEEVSESLSVKYNPQLTSLELPALIRAGDLSVTGNNLDSLSMPALETVWGELAISGEDSLSELQLGSLSTAGSIRLLSVDGLSDLSGLSGLEYVERGFYLDRMPALESLDGLESLHTVGSRFDAGECPKLVQIQGLSGLTRVDWLVLGGLESLESLEGLERLREVGSLWIGGTEVLVDLRGLEKLPELGSSLSLEHNASLRDVQDLHGLESVGGSFSIRDNTALPDAEAEALRDAIGTSNIGGSVTISGNAG